MDYIPCVYDYKTCKGGEMKTTLINYRTYNLDTSKVTPIDRRSIFGNPFKIGPGCTREQCIEKYRVWFQDKLCGELGSAAKVRTLKGKILGCWCTPLPCHGDIIIKYLKGLE